MAKSVKCIPLNDLEICQEAAEQRMLCQALLEVMDLFGVQQIVFLGRTDKTGRYQIQHLLRIRTSKTVYYQRVHILNVEWILIVVIVL